MINNMIFSKNEVDVLWENEKKTRAIFSYNDMVAYAKVLVNGQLDRITPFVRDMAYDSLNEVISVEDDLGDVSLHYFMDLRGNISTPAYVDGEQSFFSIEFIGDEDVEPFQTYYDRKDEIGSYIEGKKARIEKINRENCLKMALSSKNK